jgi:hypothetical protein
MHPTAPSDTLPREIDFAMCYSRLRMPALDQRRGAPEWLTTRQARLEAENAQQNRPRLCNFASVWRAGLRYRTTLGSGGLR